MQIDWHKLLSHLGVCVRICYKVKELELEGIEIQFLPFQCGVIIQHNVDPTRVMLKL